MIYHVCVNGSDAALGTKEAPFRTIGRAAAVAAPGDTVQVHSGEYREWVKPQNGGFNDLMRITYEAAPGEHPVIKGSEIITDWERVEGTVWKKVLDNAMFGDWNPYAKNIEGDWLVSPIDTPVHLGDVYINGVSMFEASSMQALTGAAPKENRRYNDWWLGRQYVQNPALMRYQWFAEVEEQTTTLFCNFQDIDPNRALIEINVRPACFYPVKTGLNYITVRGFEMAHAACPWAPPTSDQIGMLGVNWSKGWIIENNHLHDAKCSAVSLGKEGSTGDNWASHYGRRAAHNRQMEAMFQALQAGWSKEKIGSHIVRNNVIHDCGQNGIVGHMGGAFSRIEHNHIYNITCKQEFQGYEMGGIKLHAAVDTVIEGNLIHDCALGTWIDWQAQGMRVTKNVYFDNDRDFMIEVTHGPCTIDHNIFLSPLALDNYAQGTAYVHNLIAGALHLFPSRNRETPYHFPHSTQVAGVVPTYLGDDRLMNNIFLGAPLQEEYGGNCPHPARSFCEGYDDFPTAEEYAERLEATGFAPYDERRYEAVPQPVWISGNAYAGCAKPYRKEISAIDADGVSAHLAPCGKQWILTLRVPSALAEANCAPVTSTRLALPRMVEQPYENADGTPIDFAADFFGARRDAVIPGPFAALSADTHEFVVWEETDNA